jgi:hypothetical protein
LSAVFLDAPRDLSEERCRRWGRDGYEALKAKGSEASAFVPRPPCGSVVLMSTFFRLLAGTSCDGCSLDNLEGELTIFCADDHLVLGLERAVKDHAGELVIYAALDGAAQGPGAELGVVALLGQEVDGFVGEL